MTPVQYRPILESELDPSIDLYLEAVQDLRRRNGLPPVSHSREKVEPLIRHVQQTGIYEGAWLGDELAAVCHATVRDGLWFLSGFWVRPSLQKAGLGGPLFRQVMQRGKAHGAKTFFTWSSVDLTAMAAYMKSGLLPGTSILSLSGGPTSLPKAPLDYQLEPLDLGTAKALDLVLRGTARELDHLFLRALSDGYQVRYQGQIAGYLYVNQGVIGPVGWSEPEHGPAVLTLALQQGRVRSEKVTLVTTGYNHTAITMAFATGLQLVSSAHLLQSAPFGRLSQYLPSGPLLF